MFKWKDYEENTCLFIEGIDINVAVLRYKDFQLTDASTGNKFNEQMDKTVMEAKGEIEAFCQNKLNSIALATLSEHQEDVIKLKNPIDME